MVAPYRYCVTHAVRKSKLRLCHLRDSQSARSAEPLRSDAHVRRWCESWERCSEIQPWLMMPRLDSVLCHHRLKAVQTVRLSPAAIKMAMVILADPGRVRSTRLSCFAPRGIRRAF